MVMKDILAYYHKKENMTYISSGPKQMKIISVFSPLQKLETLIFTWALGTQLAEHRKVLLVFLELFPVPILASADPPNQSLSEFIYYLKENSNITLKLNSLLNYAGNLAYLSGVTHGADVLALGKEDIRRWLEELKDQTDYQTVIFHLGCYTEASGELMNLSDSVLIGNCVSDYEKALLMEWASQMERAGVRVDPDKFRRVPMTEEETIERLPIAIAELKQTAAWDYIKQNPDSL
jgi:hypothetical protein